MKHIPSLTMVGLIGIALAGCNQGCNQIGGSSSGTGGQSAEVKKLNGGGSSFVYPLMSKWTSEYKKANGVEINYQSIGSGGGIEQMTSKTLDFGCTDGPMTDEQLKKATETGSQVVHIPLAMGAVVPIYTLKDVDKPLKFTGKVLADIYLGKITKWTDAALKKLNPDVNLPDKDIKVVHRSDGSGTTYIWAEYLSKVSDEWNEKVGVGTSIKWPTGIGQKGSEGVSGQVKRAEGNIGYVELTYALQNKIKFGVVENKDGKYIEGSLKSVTAAADASLKDIRDDLRYSIVNPPGADAYPISGTVWAVVYVQQPENKGKPVKDFLYWITHDGQKFCEALDYARLPAGLIERIDKKLELIK